MSAVGRGSGRVASVGVGTGRWRSGQSQQTVNLPPNGLRRFKSSPAHHSTHLAIRKRTARFAHGKPGEAKAVSERSEAKGWRKEVSKQVNEAGPSRGRAKRALEGREGGRAGVTQW